MNGDTILNPPIFARGLSRKVFAFIYKKSYNYRTLNWWMLLLDVGEYIMLTEITSIEIRFGGIITYFKQLYY